jgi:hypothetical protein
VKDNQKIGNAASLEFEYPQSVPNAPPSDATAAKDAAGPKGDQGTNQSGSTENQ